MSQFHCSVGSESIILRGHCGPVYGTCLTPDNNILLSCSEDTTGKTHVRDQPNGEGVAHTNKIVWAEVYRGRSNAGNNFMHV